MVTLNKPSAGDTNWTTPINDNWTAIEGSIDQAICEGRLTLSSGNPAYNPQPKTPSSTDTGTDTITFSSPHGWTTGTMVIPNSTVGGLTNGTTYYINAANSTTATFHTTLAGAEAGTGKVDLTANITAEIQPLGVSRTTLYYAPYKGNRISLYSGSTWNIRTFSEISLALTLTSGKNYDVFVYDNAGTPTLELSAAWTDNTTRADALTTQDGIKLKSGTTTRRFLGTIRASATNTVEDSRIKRFVSNSYNRLKVGLRSTPGYLNNNALTSYTITATSWTEANAGTGSRLEFITNGEDSVRYGGGTTLHTSYLHQTLLGIGEDSIVTAAISGVDTQVNNNYSQCYSLINEYSPAEGYHYLALLFSATGGTTTVHADTARLANEVSDPSQTVISAEIMA